VSVAPESRGGDDLLARDARCAWHPYTQHATEGPPLPVRAARDAVLSLSDSRELIDAISSWWTCLHGHGRRELIAAMTSQAETLDHVLFAGATHEPAIALAEALLAVVPGADSPRRLSRVFYSDDGSTAVEVALKLCVQRWLSIGERHRTVFVALEGAYHGDTFGAMAVGDPRPFFEAFTPMLFEVRRVPPGEAGAVASALAELGVRAAGVIVEPLVQGAGGMRMHSPEFLRGVRASCDAAGVPLVADEVMTGFGRTGALFACGLAGITPDVLCLAKGLSGGLMPLAATLTTESMFEAFLSHDRARAFFHGHSFTAHPVACAVALASLRLCLAEDTPARLDAIGRDIERGLRERLAASPRGETAARSVRRRGGIVAFDLGTPGGYLGEVAPRLRAEAVARGVLLRPLGNVLYAMPPACTTEAQCDRIAEVMAELATLPG
jgi:adenosylmethionine-8-amino-7-oxononanoate aminotransferase